MEEDKAKALIKKHEGCRLKPYQDSVGILTIGWGRNLQANGITQEEADLMFEYDYTHAVSDAISFVGAKYWPALNEVRQAVLIDMAFNLGATSLSLFAGFRKALQEERWAGAAIHMRGSLWFTQTKKRALRLVKMMETGEWE